MLEPSTFRVLFMSRHLILDINKCELLLLYWAVYSTQCRISITRKNRLKYLCIRKSTVPLPRRGSQLQAACRIFCILSTMDGTNFQAILFFHLSEHEEIKKHDNIFDSLAINQWSVDSTSRLFLVLQSE